MWPGGSAFLSVFLLVTSGYDVTAAASLSAQSVLSRSEQFLHVERAPSPSSWSEGAQVIQHSKSVDVLDRPVQPSLAATLLGEHLQLHSIHRGAGKWVDAALSIYGLLTALVFVVPLLMWLFGVARVVIIFTFYLGLYMAWAMLTYATRDIPHNAGILVLTALLMKFVVSLVLWRLWEGSSFLQLPCAAWEARSTLIQYVVPASLYAVSDVIRVDALRALDASTFAILFNSRMLFLAFLWQWVMNRKLYMIHWVSLIAVLAGCFLKELSHVDLAGEDETRRHWAYAEIGLLGVITCIATVWNEMLLQKRADAGVSLQNMAMYTFGTVCLVCVQTIWMFVSPDRLISPWRLASWQAVWGEPLVLAAAFVLAIYGIATAYFLRYLSNITREVTLGAFAPLLSVVMDATLFELTLGHVEYAGLVLVLVGVILFAFKPVLAIDAADSGADNASDDDEKIRSAFNSPRMPLPTSRTTARSNAINRNIRSFADNTVGYLERMWGALTGAAPTPRADADSDDSGLSDDGLAEVAEFGNFVDSDLIIMSPREPQPVQLEQVSDCFSPREPPREPPRESPREPPSDK